MLQKFLSLFSRFKSALKRLFGAFFGNLLAGSNVFIGKDACASDKLSQGEGFFHWSPCADYPDGERQADLRHEKPPGTRYLPLDDDQAASEIILPTKLGFDYPKQEGPKGWE